MKKNNDSMYERGFNVAFYLSEYAPQILARAMKGLKGEPKEFFDGLKEGQAHSNRVKSADDKKQKEKEDLEYWKDYRNEKEKEERYQQKMKEDLKKKKDEAEIEGRLLEREMRNDHVQKRLEELNKIRNREQQEKEKYPKVEVFQEKQNELEKKKENPIQEVQDKTDNNQETEITQEGDKEISEQPALVEERMNEINQTRAENEITSKEEHIIETSRE